MKKTFSLLIICLILSSGSIILSQEQTRKNEPDPVTLHRAEVVKMRSAVNGVTYPVNIALPGSYYATDRTYPVVYLLDAYSSFGIVTEMARLLASSKELPEIILVGISSEGGSKEFIYNRSRDYTPTQIPKEKLPEALRSSIPVSGGAEKFLGFIREELIPFVESKYRIKSGDRTLAGHSLGGLFVLYSLFREPSLFNRYIAVSPALLWDNEFVLRQENIFFADNKILNAVVYTAVGEKEGEEFVSSWKRLTSKMKERNYMGLDLRIETAESESHYSIIPYIVTHGLKSVFNPGPVDE